MKAAYLKSEGQLVITEVEAPTIQEDDQVLIQVKAAGICGSEVHAFAGSHPFRKAPVILGHELAGIVSEVGGAVTGFKTGDRVLVDPQWTCGECEYCLAGDINLCPSKKVLGTKVWPGAFGEYVLVPQESVFPVPARLSYLQACLVEPLTVGVHVVRRSGLREGQSAVILGSGSIGGMVSGACRVTGANPIITVDVRQHCLDAARERMGSTHDLMLPDDDIVDKVRALGGGEGVDVAFVTADDTRLVNQAIQMVKRRGRIVLVALLTEAPLQLEAYDVISQEKEILGSSMGTEADVERAIELAVTGLVDVEGILTHVLPLEEVQRGMELSRSKEDDAIKVILTFDG